MEMGMGIGMETVTSGPGQGVGAAESSGTDLRLCSPPQSTKLEQQPFRGAIARRPPNDRRQ